MKRALLSILSLIMLSGCTHVISEQSRKMVDPTLDFTTLRQNPEAHVGKQVLLGGVIAGVKNTKEGGRMEVVQFDLDRTGFPEDGYSAGGRFLATSPTFLEEMVYRRGRLITMVGEVKGKRTLPLDEVTYDYPVVSMKEVHLWQNYDSEQPFPYPPPLPYYDPYYFGHWPDFYWYRPLGPVLR